MFIQINFLTLEKENEGSFVSFDFENSSIEYVLKEQENIIWTALIIEATLMQIVNFILKDENLVSINCMSFILGLDILPILP